MKLSKFGRMKGKRASEIPLRIIRGENIRLRIAIPLNFIGENLREILSSSFFCLILETVYICEVLITLYPALLPKLNVLKSLQSSL